MRGDNRKWSVVLRSSLGLDTDMRARGWRLVRHVEASDDIAIRIQKLLRPNVGPNASMKIERFITLVNSIEGVAAGQAHAERLVKYHNGPKSWHGLRIIFPGTIWDSREAGWHIPSIKFLNTGRWELSFVGHLYMSELKNIDKCRIAMIK